MLGIPNENIRVVQMEGQDNNNESHLEGEGRDIITNFKTLVVNKFHLHKSKSSHEND